MARSYKKKRERNANGPKSRQRLARLTVRARPGHPSQGLLTPARRCFPARSGAAASAPTSARATAPRRSGRMRLLSGYFRGDHVGAAGRRGCAMKPIDAATRLVRGAGRPQLQPAGQNALWRQPRDHASRRPALRLLPRARLEHVDRARRGRGSAIFFHLARPGFTPTQGCVAVTEKVMARSAAVPVRPNRADERSARCRTAPRQRRKRQTVVA